LNDVVLDASKEISDILMQSFLNGKQFHLGLWKMWFQMGQKYASQTSLQVRSMSFTVCIVVSTLIVCSQLGGELCRHQAIESASLSRRPSRAHGLTSGEALGCIERTPRKLVCAVLPDRHLDECRTRSS
jgi:hypothetical protein